MYSIRWLQSNLSSPEVVPICLPSWGALFYGVLNCVFIYLLCILNFLKCLLFVDKIKWTKATQALTKGYSCRGNEHCNKDCLHTHTFNAHSNVEPWLVKWYFNSQFKESKHIIWVRKSVGKINSGYENTPQSVVPQCSDLFKICWFILCQIWCFNEEKKVPDWVFGSSNIIDWLIFLWFLLFMRIIAVCCKNVLTYYVKL